MATSNSTSSFASSTATPTPTFFTITQFWNGAPLHFQPALGSKELEALIDAFVPGSAPKQNKLSQVTIDFFNHATVDISNGSRTRQYNVVTYDAAPNNAFADEQSPTMSLSSGSPTFTPSPSSSATFAESVRGSVSMTPPNRTYSGRVTKKPKKETKKAAEASIPGFKIMTRDGIDVTSSAGRGTKTKEQREHAHLMRIMKACDSCKKKKIRCDPSHRRSHTDMSRTSTKTSSSSQHGPSPPASVPSLSRESTGASSEAVLPTAGMANVADFLLFSEEPSWPVTDDMLPSFQSNYDFNDFSNFNYDINNSMNDFDFSSYEQSSAESSQDIYNTNQHGLDHWDDLLSASIMSQSPNNLFAPLQDSEQLKSGWYSSASGKLYSDSPLSGSDAMILQSSSVGQTPVLADGSDLYASSSSSPTGWNSQISTPLDEASLSASDGEAVLPSRGNRRERRTANTRGAALSHAAIQRLVDAVPSYTPGHTLADLSDSRDDAQVWSNAGGEGGSSHESAHEGSFTGHSRDVYGSGIEKLSSTVKSSISAFSSAQPELQDMAFHLQQLYGVLDRIDSTHLSGALSDSVLSTILSVNDELQNVLTSLRNSPAKSARPTHQGHRQLDPIVNPELAQQCMVNVQSMSRTISELIDRAQTSSRGVLPRSHTLLPTPAAGHENLRLLRDGVHNANDSSSSSSTLSSAHSNNVSHDVIQREDSIANGLSQSSQQQPVLSRIETGPENVHHSQPTSSTAIRSEQLSLGTIAKATTPRIVVVDLETLLSPGRSRTNSLEPQQPSLAELTAGRHGFFPSQQANKLRTLRPSIAQVERPSAFDTTIAENLAKNTFSAQSKTSSTSSSQHTAGLPSSTSHSDQPSASSSPRPAALPSSTLHSDQPSSSSSVPGAQRVSDVRIRPTASSVNVSSPGRVLHTQLFEGLDQNILFSFTAIVLFSLNILLQTIPTDIIKLISSPAPLATVASAMLLFVLSCFVASTMSQGMVVALVKSVYSFTQLEYTSCHVVSSMARKESVSSSSRSYQSIMGKVETASRSWTSKFMALC